MMFFNLYCLRPVGPNILKMGRDTFREHMSFKRTKARTGYTFYWPTLWQDCQQLVKTCETCQLKARVTYRDHVMRTH